MRMKILFAILLVVIAGCASPETESEVSDDSDEPLLPVHPEYFGEFICTAMHTGVIGETETFNAAMPDGWATRTELVAFATYQVEYKHCGDLAITEFLFAFVTEHPDDVGHMSQNVKLVMETYVDDMDHPYIQAIQNRGAAVYEATMELQETDTLETILTLESNRGTWMHWYPQNPVTSQRTATGFGPAEYVFLGEDGSYFSTEYQVESATILDRPEYGTQETTGAVFAIEPDYGTRPALLTDYTYNITLPAVYLTNVTSS